MRPEDHLFMARTHLREISPAAPPPDCLLRTYRPGDEIPWLALVRAVYGGKWGEDTFERCVRADEAFRPERLFLAESAGRLVGTAGAFQKLAYGDQTGYVHMLAVEAESQGKGIGSALLARCLEYFRDMGWRNAVLDTDRHRLPAIRLYLRSGFLPLPETLDELEEWRRILPALGYAGMAERLRQGVVAEGSRGANDGKSAV